MKFTRHATTLLPLLLVVLLPRGAAAQSTTGVLEGTVRTSAGVPLSEVQLTVRPLHGGLERMLETDAEGRFEVTLLDPGSYEVLAEQLGFRPLVLTPIPVRVGRRVGVELRLDRAEGVVESPDRRLFDRGIVGASRPGRSRVFPEWEQRAVPLRDGDAVELLNRSSQAEAPLEVEGLPAAFGVVSIDGIPVGTLADAGAMGEGLSPLLFPLKATEAAELMAGRPDVEWPAAAGGLLALMSPPGERGFGGEVDGFFASDEMALDDGPGFTNWQAGGSASGSIAGDSAHVWLDARASARERPTSYIPRGSAALVETLQASGLDLDPLASLRTTSEERTSAAAGFDWSFSDGQSVRVGARYAEGSSQEVTGFLGLPARASAEGSDFLGTAAATTELGGALALQVRLGYSNSRRDYASANPIETPFGGGAAVALLPDRLQLGGDPGLPADLERSGVYGQGTLHVQAGDHALKGGLGFAGSWHDREWGYSRQGVYRFGGAGSYQVGEGSFVGTQGGTPAASFSTQEYFAYAQDLWRLAPGLDLTTGLRYEVEVLPTGGLVRNRRWFELTGIDNSDVNGVAPNVGFAVGFDWDIQEAHQWLVRADATVDVGDVLPELLAEGLTRDGRIDAARQVGDVSPGSTPEGVGARLSIFDPSLAPPVTSRGSFGVTRALNGGLAVHLGGVLRQTENLPRRRDLNLRTTAAFLDQYDRPVFGPLRQTGAVLAPVPGQNRRFREFDAVSALSTDGSSMYWGVTASIEKQAGDLLRLVGSYTYSSTRDDWGQPVAEYGLTGVPAFGGSDEFEEWTEGVSAYDIPHRATGTVELRMPFFPGLSFGTSYRISSGRPFTPGLGPGVDANADGIFGNDPAFVDDGLDGMEPLLQEWECLRTNAGRFAARNSCRLPARTSLDAWIGIASPALLGIGGEFRLEALGLDAEGTGVYDTALLLVDPEGTTELDPTTGRITVPVQVNPRFGDTIIPGSELTLVRLSLRLWF